MRQLDKKQNTQNVASFYIPNPTEKTKVEKEGVITNGDVDLNGTETAFWISKTYMWACPWMIDRQAEN